MTQDLIERFPPGSVLRLPCGTWSTTGVQRGTFDYYVKVDRICPLKTGGYQVTGDQLEPDGSRWGRALVWVASLDDIRVEHHAC